MMGQKAHPNSLRPFRDQYQGYARWNEGDYHQDLTYIPHVVKQCCYKTNLYTNNIEVIPGNRKLTVRCELIHFHDERRHWWDKIDYKLRRRKEWRRRKTEKFEILEPKRSELKRQFRRQFGYRYRFRLRPIVEALLKKEDKKDKSYRRVRVIRRMLRSRAIRACKIKKEKEKLLKIIRLKKLINDCTKKWGKKVKGKEAKANLIGAGVWQVVAWSSWRSERIELI